MAGYYAMRPAFCCLNSFPSQHTGSDYLENHMLQFENPFGLIRLTFRLLSFLLENELH